MLQSTVHEFPFTATVHDLQDFPLKPIDALLASAKWSGWSWERIRTTWIEPRFLSQLSDLESWITSHLILLRNTDDEGQIIAIYPVCSQGVHATISLARTEESEPEGLYLRARKISNSTPAEKLRACAVVVRSDAGTRDVHNVVAKAVQVAREWLYRVEGAGEPEPFVGLDKKSPLEGVGFCTWSSIGEGVKPTVENLTSLLTSLSSASLPIQSFMLDDGWLDTRPYIDSADGTEYPDIPGWNAALWDFSAAPSLGTSISGVVSLVKKHLPGVRDVGVWMTLEGYWKGIHPDSPLVRKYEFKGYELDRAYMPGIDNHPGNVTYLPTGHGTWYLPAPTHAYAFWHDWFTYLAGQGITWVKVDNQASMSFLAGTEGAEAHTAMWEGMTRAANDVWGPGAVVYCMSHSERMYNGDAALGLATKGEKIVVRNSDDFGLLWRHNAHELHIFYNVYTSILTSQLCHVPDADMCMTAAQLPLYHALLRALVPGPLLLTDKQNEHDLEIVAALVGHTKTGEASVVKTQQACRPLANRLFPTSTSDEPVGNGGGPPVIGYVSYPRIDSAILAAWNTRDRDHPGKSVVALTVLDILDALERPATQKTLDESYVVYRHGYTGGLGDSQDRQVTVVTPETYAEQSLMSLDLEHNACEAFTVAKMYTLQYEENELRVACLGLVDKFAGLSGLQSVKISKDSITCKVSSDGILGYVVICPIPMRPEHLLRCYIDREDVNEESWNSSSIAWSPEQEAEGQWAYLLQVPVQQNGKEGDCWTVDLKISAKKALLWKMTTDR